MKASARNQWAGRVAEIHRGAVNAEVLVTLNGGVGLVASITKESVESLGLKQGKEVLALVKAPMVMVMTDLEGYRLSARNQLTGQIAHLHQGPVSTDVVIGLPGGDSVVASITSDSCEALGLAPGQTATAVFKASAVILGVAG